MTNTARYIQDQPVPEGTRPAGYGAIVETFGIRAPLRQLTVVSERSVKGNVRVEGSVVIRDKRDWPGSELVDHIDFAMRREPLDLLILKRAFVEVDEEALADSVRSSPYSVSKRRAWFLYEWLTGKMLDVPDVRTGGYELALDPDEYHAIRAGAPATRQRLYNNMPGTKEFCPLVRRKSSTLLGDIGVRAHEIVHTTDPNLMHRAAAHLATGDSRSSFEIEGERPSADRLVRWGQTLARAGRGPLDLKKLEQLQVEILGTDTNRRVGLRQDGVFIGAHSRTGDPVPEFIGARPDDLPELMTGLLAFHERASRSEEFDPVAHAASVAFPFVFIHPFEDGNGRLHRYLIQDALARHEVSPKGIVLPVSSELLRQKLDYFGSLERHSAPLMDFIPWRATPSGNVEITADTSDLYRYPDVTDQAEFLRACMEKTVEFEMPREIRYIAGYDTATEKIDKFVEMPSARISKLVSIINEGQGYLSKGKRKSLFRELSDEQLEAIEVIVREAFGWPEKTGSSPISTP